MSTRLERCMWMTIVVVALLAGALAALPAVAEAQVTYEAPTQVEQNANENADRNAGTGAGRRVVEPGDSLWSIAQERLGPNAGPEWVAAETDRIYALNREWIGDDPNLILVGQELLLSPGVSPVVGEEEPSAAAPPRVYEPSTSKEGYATTPVATLAEEPASEELAGEESAEPNEEPTQEPATGVEEEEDPAAAAPAAEEGSPSSKPEDVIGVGAAEQPRTLGLGILLLTVLIAALIAWRLHARRKAGAPAEVAPSPPMASTATPKQKARSEALTDALRDERRVVEEQNRRLGKVEEKDLEPPRHEMNTEQRARNDYNPA